MVYNFNSRHFVLLVLVFGLQFYMISCDEEEEEETDPRDDDSSAESIEKVNEDEVRDELGESEEGECHNPSNTTKKLCCKNDDIIDDALIKCYLLHQKKAPKPNEENVAVLVKFFSCLIECVYKAKKYIAKGDNLNMKMITSDAKKTYKNSKKEQQYTIEMYEHCGRKAKIDWNGLKKNTAVRFIFTGACKPYFTYVFFCVYKYADINCPYFKWKGNTESKETCVEMRNKCERLLGEK